MARSRVPLRLTPIVGLVLMCGLVTAPQVEAQESPSAPRVSTSVTEPLLFPRLMLSLGVGVTSDAEGGASTPLETLSIQFLASRHVVVEGDITYWRERWDRPSPGYTLRSSRGQVMGFSGDFVDSGTRTTWSPGINIMFRTEPRRASVYVGGGPILAFVQEASTYGTVGCSANPGFEYFCQGRGVRDTSASTRRLALRAVAGADIRVAHRLRAYADLQFFAHENGFVRFTTGMRAEALKQSAVTSTQARVKALAKYGTGHAASAPSALGKTVRVTFIGGRRFEGTLLELSTTRLTVRRHGKVLDYPLDQVLIVETAHHKARVGAIIGAIGGAVLSALVFTEGDDLDVSDVTAMFGAMGAAIGASIGLGMDRTLPEFHVLYLAPLPQRP